MTLQDLFAASDDLWQSSAWVQAGLVVLAALVAAGLAHLVFTRVLARLAASTATDLDDEIVAACRKPVFFTVLMLGLAAASRLLDVPEPGPFVVDALVKSLVIALWSVAANRVSQVLLAFMTDNERFELVQVRSRPIFELLAKVLVWGSAIYLVLLTWNIDATGWIASAGVVGVAVGFAAKDTVANLFSGVFIMADAPYKIGDYVVLGSGERGMVTDIGMRSTRILTRDDIEVIVPNAVIAGAKIMNETGGPHEMRRVRCTVDLAYGCDVDHAREVLQQAAAATPYLSDDPAPRVRFREFGPSGIRFQVMGWVEEPVLRGRAVDALNTAVYKGLLAAGIEIPYSKHDVYIKEVPAGAALREA